jgi:prophage regulatory protein
MSNQTQLADTVYRLPEVMRRVALSRSSIYAMVAAGSFPAPVPIGTRARGWLSSEISSWLSQRIEARSTGQVRAGAA